MRRRWTVIVVALSAVGAFVAVQAAGAGPAHAVPGMQLVSGDSAYDSETTKAATAYCPDGTRVLGGGGGIMDLDVGLAARVQITRLQPIASTDSYTATATEMGPYDETWQLTAFAICGEAPPGLEYQSYHTFNNSSVRKDATVVCSRGKQVIGTGARTEGGDGQVIIEDIVPAGSLHTVGVSAVEVSAGYAGNWSMWGYAVCADPLPGLELRSAVHSPEYGADVVGVSCSWPTKKVHGLGMRIDGADGGVMHGAMWPTEDLYIGQVSSSTGLAFVGAWSNTAYVICAY